MITHLGELSRHISRTYGEQSYKEPTTKAQAKQKIADELADIIFVTICLANQMDINLEASIEKNIAKKTNRDNKRHHSNKKL